MHKCLPSLRHRWLRRLTCMRGGLHAGCWPFRGRAREGHWGQQQWFPPTSRRNTAHTGTHHRGFPSGAAGKALLSAQLQLRSLQRLGQRRGPSLQCRQLNEHPQSRHGTTAGGHHHQCHIDVHIY